MRSNLINSEDDYIRYISWRLEKEKRANPNRHDQGLFDLQVKFIDDPSVKKTLCNSRRSGKTYSIIHLLAKEAEKRDEANILYLTDTRDHAKELVWDELKKLVPDATPDNQRLIMKFTNGSKVKLYGCDQDRLQNRLLGFAWSAVVIDEAQAIDNDLLKKLCLKTLGPALKDYQGSLILAGTPYPTSLFFRECCTASSISWTHHGWNVDENPMYPVWKGKPNWREIAKATKEQWRIDECFEPDDPVWLMEYCGIWADDMTLKVHKCKMPTYDPPYPGSIKYTLLGIDLGFNDETSWVVCGVDQYNGTIVQLYEDGKKGLSLSDLAVETDKVIKQFSPAAVVIDISAGGKHLEAEIQRRYRMPCVAADKTAKAAMMRVMDAEMRRGHFLALRDSKLEKQANEMLWDKKFQRELEGQPADVYDATIYLVRYALNTKKRVDQNPHKEDRDELFEHTLQRAEEEAEMKSWLE